MWTDAAGSTHQSRCEIRNLAPASLGKGVQTVFIDKLENQAKAVWILQFPKGWIGQWHENPYPQWIVPLSGRWFVETNDGKRVEMGPGEASFGEDQASKPDKAGHKGHLSGTVGDASVTLMLVLIARAPTTDDACWMR